MTTKEQRYARRHPDRRAATKAANYRQTRAGAERAGRRWAQWEDAYIVAHPKLDDRAIASILKRSVQAIQVHRAKLRRDDE